MSSPEALVDVFGEENCWKGGEQDAKLRLPTFTRAIPRRKPPAGIKSCSEETLSLWRRDEMKYPPYTYKPEFLIFLRKLKGAPGRVACASEREKLMGFKEGHTEALFREAPKDDAGRKAQEVERCAALGNSFHAVAVGCLIDIWLWSAGMRTDSVGAEAIIKRWHEEMKVKSPTLDGSVAEEGGTASVEAWSEEESQAVAHLTKKANPEWLRLSSHKELRLDDPRLLAVRLVHHYLRRMEYRGSDVRLDLQVIFKPDSVTRTTIQPAKWAWRIGQSYPFPKGQRINILELKAILRALEWRARSSCFHSVRFMHLSDSQICRAVLAKRRSSSRVINRILRRIHALCISLNLYPLWGWVASRLNPADAPSRRYA